MTRRKQQQIIEKKEEVSDTNENVKKLLDMLAADPSFAEQAAACKSIKEFIALAKKKGLVLTEEEVRAATDERGKLSPLKLEEISGGTAQEAESYARTLMLKYGVQTKKELDGKMTPTEQEIWARLLFHKEGEPWPDGLIS